MLPANKNRFLDGLLYLYFRNRARRTFSAVAGRGLDHLRTLLPVDRPVLLFCNHTNWWDGLIVFLLTRQMRHKAVYCMMEEKQLKHYRFFTWPRRLFGRSHQPGPLRRIAPLRATPAPTRGDGDLDLPPRKDLSPR